MKKLHTKVLSLITCLTLVITFVPSVFAVNYDENTQKLIDHGVPVEVASQLSDSEKEFICSNLTDISSYSGYTVEEIDVPAENGMPSRAAPPSNKLVITLLTFNESPKNGYARKSFYPTFEWKQITRLENDVFGFSLGTGWYAETAGQQLAVHILNSSGNFVLSRTLTAADHARQTQYSTCYTIPQYCGTAQTKYKGGAVFYAQKRSSGADNRLHYDYISDTTNSIISISIPVTPLASITVLNLTTGQYNKWDGLITFPIS